MSGQMLNYRRYQESLSKMSQPIMPSQLPKIKMDLAGMSNYAKKKGVSLHELSAQEKKRFMPWFKNLRILRKDSEKFYRKAWTMA